MTRAFYQGKVAFLNTRRMFSHWRRRGRKFVVAIIFKHGPRGRGGRRDKFLGRFVVCNNWWRKG